MDWKWNRSYVPSILTVALQQDYVTQVTDLGWLEQGWRIDINNTSNSPTGQGVKPIFTMESVRDLGQTSTQAQPFQLSWIPNDRAFMGTWQPSTVYPCGYGAQTVPRSPIQQFIDANGNILFINSNTLGLSINSPGGTVVTGTPYGTSGLVQPVLPAASLPGATVVDGTVTWTVADPNGIAIRLTALPPLGGLTWLVVPVYQRKPVILTSIQQVVRPIPDEFMYMFRRGFYAKCFEHAGTKNAPVSYAQWEEEINIAVRSGDREREEAVFYPSESLTMNGPARGTLPVGPAWPYSSFDGGGW